MPDRLIVGGDYQLRIKHFRALGLTTHEIARMLGISQERVNFVLRTVDSRQEHTTTNS